jgi:hypothetical protein
MATGCECTQPGMQLEEDWQHSWPHQIAKHYDIPYFNYGWPAQSNNSISLNLQIGILKALKTTKAEDIFVIVGWTEFSRSEYSMKDNIFYLCSGVFENYLNGNLDIKKNDELEYVIKAWASEEIDNHINKFLWTYWSLVQFLKNHNIQYFFFDAINNAHLPRQDLIFLNSKFRYAIHPTEEIWNIMSNDPYYDRGIPQNDWLLKNYPECAIGNGIGQKHWNPTALNAWANYLITKIDLI